MADCVLANISKSKDAARVDCTVEGSEISSESGANKRFDNFY